MRWRGRSADNGLRPGLLLVGVGASGRPRLRAQTRRQRRRCQCGRPRRAELFGFVKDGTIRPAELLHHSRHEALRKTLLSQQLAHDDETNNGTGAQRAGQSRPPRAPRACGLPQRQRLF